MIFKIISGVTLYLIVQGIPKRLGYARGLSGRLLSSGLSSFKDILPPIEHQFKVLNLLGISSMQDYLELWYQEEDSLKIKKLLHDSWINEKDKVVAFVLEASSRWKTKNWPLEKYSALAERIEEELGAKVIVVGDPSQKEVCERFMIQTSATITDFVGKTNLREFFALIGEVNFLVAGDTAPIHVASALGIKSAVFFGPTDPKRHMPPGKKSNLMQHKTDCMPCYQTKCKHPKNKKGVSYCLDSVSVDEVFLKVKEGIAE